MFACSFFVSLPNSNKPSTNNLMPLSVGNLPEEVWGAYKRPSFCKSAKIDLIDAEEISIDPFFNINTEKDFEIAKKLLKDDQL